MGYRIQASQNGFYLADALGNPLAADITMMEHLNTLGRITYDPDQNQWSAITIGEEEIRFILEASDGPDSDMRFTGGTAYRIEDGNPVKIATVEFGEAGLVVSATLAPNGVWSADIAPPMLEMIKNQGLNFEGGNGVDIFEPSAEPLYYQSPSHIHLRGGDDIAIGTKGDDVIKGGHGDDIISDDHGRNKLFGGAGDDHITLGNYSNGSVAKGGRGDDVLISGHGSDKLVGGKGQDSLFGHNGQDLLKGGAGNDSLDGGDGKDRLHGGRGDDQLIGGKGNDKLIGGKGADSFVFYQSQDGRDKIVDFEQGVDRIHLPDYLDGFDNLILTDTSKGVVISFEDDPAEIFLKGISAENLSADDFSFDPI